MSVHRCCCGTCCNVTGPLWANRYCFQMTGYEATYEKKECRYNWTDPNCGPQYCEEVPGPGAGTDADCQQNSVVCHTKTRMTACASGAVFRGLIFSQPIACGCANDCSTSCPAGPPNSFGDPACVWWIDVYNETGALLHQGVCDKPTWVPPDVTPTGCDSVYQSPPCDCVIAQNDRATAKGVTQYLDLSGYCWERLEGQEPPCTVICVPMDEADEPYECPSRAIMECRINNQDCIASSEACSAPYPSVLRRHRFTVVVGTGSELGGPDCEACPVGMEFVFEADLGPDVPPDQAVWTCVEAPAYCQTLVCEEPDCGGTYPEDPCGSRNCEDWTGCYTNADNPECNGQDLRCRGCDGPSTLVLPTLTFTPYQNCTYAEGC